MNPERVAASPAPLETRCGFRARGLPAMQQTSPTVLNHAPSGRPFMSAVNSANSHPVWHFLDVDRVVGHYEIIHA